MVVARTLVQRGRSSRWHRTVGSAACTSTSAGEAATVAQMLVGGERHARWGQSDNGRDGETRFALGKQIRAVD